MGIAIFLEMRICFFTFWLLFLFSSCQSSSFKYLQDFFLFEEEVVEGGWYKVSKVIDGDTFWAQDSVGDELKIRLIGVDAPETRNVFNKKKHPFGHVSKQYLTDFIWGDVVQLQFDVDSLDRYGRTLAYVYRADGTFVNEHMVRQGYATIMTVQPNVKYADLFLQAQEYARDNGLGVWGDEYVVEE